MVTVSMNRRRREPLLKDDERDIRENIICYDDEGGGEEDTKAFDMFALRQLNQTQPAGRDAAEPPLLPLTRSLRPHKDKNRLFQEFIRDRLKEAGLDPTAPPYDSLQTYAFEGRGSAAQSLSSLSSLSSLESQQSYQFLREWGPSFRKLADLYGHHEGGGGDVVSGV